MTLSPNVSLRSMYPFLPSFWGSPFNQEIDEVISGARSVSVNVLGSRSEKEQRMYLQKSSRQPSKRKFRAHKMLFVYGADEAVGFGLRWIVGVASFMFGSVSAPVTGHDLERRRFAVSELSRIEEEFRVLGRTSQYQRRDPVANAMAEMLFHERKIFQIIKSNAETILFIRIVLLISAAIGFLGALGVADVVLIGAVGMFSTACVMVLKMGLDATAFHVRREAGEMRRYVDFLLNVRWITGDSSAHYPAPNLRA